MADTRESDEREAAAGDDTQPASPGERRVNEIPEPGTLVGGTYRIKRRLGAGSTGTVLLALDEQLDREVAIKFIELGDDESGALLELFRGEARAMARVRHPNVVQIFNFGDHRGAPYFVMEYVPGTSLAAEGAAPSTIAEVVSLLEQLCLGVEAIHDGGTVHNDLKPGNILIGPGRRVVVADLGLAATQEQADKVAFAGTPAYIAPETARGEAVQPALAHRRDIYSLGVIAYELLTGERPFTAKGWQGQLQQHAYDDPPAASSRRPECHPAFDEVLFCALAKTPEQRTPTAAAFRRELVEAQRRATRLDRPLRVLLVDDDRPMLEALAELLTDEFPGATIDRASTAEAAYELAVATKPDVVVTDLHMPGRSGFCLTEDLRANPATAKVPIIVVTGLGGAKDWKVLRALGADRFLVKPVAVESLVSAICALVSRRR